MKSLIRKFFGKDSEDFSKEITRTFSREMVGNLISGEYVDEFAKRYHQRYHNMHKTLSQKNFVATLTNVFHEMLEPFLHEENSKTAKLLIVKLIKRIIETSHEYDVKFSQNLIASGYQAWFEIQRDNHTICGFNEAFDGLIDIEYNDGEEWPWSFDSFSVLYNIAKEKLQETGTNFFNFEMQTIFIEHFEIFLLSASFDSIKFLKKIEDEGFFIAGNIFDNMARNNKITYEYIDVVENVAHHYPELRTDMYNSILKSLIYSNWEDMLYIEQNEIVERFSYYIWQLLHKMVDYAKYQSIVFEVKKYWKQIIDCVFNISNGCILNGISELLVENFGIPKEVLENYIEEKTWGLLMSVYVMGEIDYSKIFDSATRLLSNKVVYNVVISQAFEFYDLKLW